MIGAALFYFANPFDIISDHTLATGYLDDAHVINLCIKGLDKSEPRLFKLYLDRVLGATDS